LLVFNDYNAEENRLILTYTVQGTYVVNFQRTSDIKDSQYSALRDDCAAAFGVDLIDIGSIADGTAIPYAGRGFGSWHMKFSGEAQLPDAGNNVLVYLIQEDCVHSVVKTQLRLNYFPHTPWYTRVHIMIRLMMTLYCIWLAQNRNGTAGEPCDRILGRIIGASTYVISLKLERVTVYS
jgi:hypothetical protein